MHCRQEGVIQRDELWWSGTAAVRLLGKSFQRRYQIGVLKQRQIVGYGFESTLVLKLPL
jgi:hypothetical protein